LKLKPHQIKDNIKVNINKYGFLNYPVESPQQYINILKLEFETILFKIKYDKDKGLETTSLENRLNFINNELDLMYVETKDDFVYVPKGKVKVKSIQDILYYEALYGKKIYEKDACYEESV